jgi:hypothetical protein
VIGAVAKKGSLTGASYRVEATTALEPSRVGVIDLFVVKDRPGAIRRNSAARKRDGSQHAARITFDARDPDKITTQITAVHRTLPTEAVLAGIDHHATPRHATPRHATPTTITFVSVSVRSRSIPRMFDEERAIASGRDEYIVLPYPDRDIDAIVWHHTNADGLIGIISDQRVRASSFRTLNDSSEIDYGLRALREFLDEYLERETMAAEEIVRAALDRTAGSVRGSAYVFCATRKKDSLNQWQHYSGSQGYAVGFRPRSYMTTWDEPPFLTGFLQNEWVDVIYDRDRQREIARSMFAIFDDIQSLTSWRDANKRRILDGLLAYLMACFKHTSFAAEEETRFVVFDSMSARQKFRAGRRGLVPYVECGFGRFPGESLRLDGQPNDAVTSLSAVMCGPGTPDDKEEDIANVRRLLDSFEYPPDASDVSASEIPYRF